MASKKEGSKSTVLKKPRGKKSAEGKILPYDRDPGDPPILHLGLEGRIKIADIRKAVLAVRAEKIAAKLAAENRKV